MTHEHDEQFCIEHGMFHSVELRSVSCKFEFEAAAEASSEVKSYCSEERPCIPCFSDSGPCDAPPPAELGKGDV